MTALRAEAPVATAPDRDNHSAVFTALSDPIRRAIVERLAHFGSMNVGDLSAPFTVSETYSLTITAPIERIAPRIAATAAGFAQRDSQCSCSAVATARDALT